MLDSQTLRGKLMSECSLPTVASHNSKLCVILSLIWNCILHSPNPRFPHARYSGVYWDQTFWPVLNSHYFELRIKLTVKTTHVLGFILFYINSLTVKVKLSSQKNSHWGLSLNLEVGKKNLRGHLLRTWFNQWEHWGMDKLSSHILF